MSGGAGYANPIPDEVIQDDGVILRLLNRVFLGDECWIHEKPTWQGYAKIERNGVKYPAHRVMYGRFVGPLTEGLVIDHLCRVRNCIRPDHLEQVTQKENRRRMKWHPPLKDTCGRGHPRPPERRSKRCAECQRQYSNESYPIWRAAASALGMSTAAYLKEYGRTVALAQSFIDSATKGEQ